MKIFLLTLLLLTSCSSPITREKVNSALTQETKAALIMSEQRTDPVAHGKDGLRLIIPKDSWEPIFFESINERAQAAKLRSLRSVVLPKDDFEVRVWVGFGLTFLQGFVLKRAGGQWSATHLDAMVTRKHLSAYEKKLEAPKSGWETAWQKLVDEGILTLPDASAVGCDTGFEDGVSYVVEFNKDRTYRTYLYDNPDESECNEAKQMVRIGEIIADEFGVEELRLGE